MIQTLTSNECRSGNNAGPGSSKLVPESAVLKVQQHCLDQGIKISYEDALKDLIGAVNLVRLVLSSASSLSPALAKSVPESGSIPTYYRGNSHA